MSEMVDDSDPWGCSSDSDESYGEIWEEGGDGREGDDIDIPLLNDNNDPSTRAIIRLLAKEGYKSGKSSEESRLMQEGFDKGFIQGMSAGKACGRLYGRLRLLLKVATQAAQMKISSKKTNTSSEDEDEDGGLVRRYQTAVTQLEPLLFHTLPTAVSSSLTAEGHGTGISVPDVIQSIMTILAPLDAQSTTKVQVQTQTTESMSLNLRSDFLLDMANCMSADLIGNRPGS